jgi:hypothetical protein
MAPQFFGQRRPLGEDCWCGGLGGGVEAEGAGAGEAPGGGLVRLVLVSCVF